MKRLRRGRHGGTPEDVAEPVEAVDVVDVVDVAA